jgi:CPA1 family monovalent cation:H+ antiporter
VRDVTPTPPRTPDGCEDCLRIGARWLHLRLCLHCGHVGCCDSSPNRHARRHFQDARHPVIASFEPNERWAWCFADETDFDVPERAAPYLR